MIADQGPTRNYEEILTDMVGQYQSALLNMCLICLKNRASAEDAVQETFIKAYRALPNFRGECSEKTWLMRIAINTCRDMTRTPWVRHTDRRVTPEDMTGLAAPEQQSSGLAAEISSLPDRYRDVLLLYYYQDMKLEEVAAALNTSPATVSRRLKAAREKLRGVLERGSEL